jgi:hypothetical protein
LCAAFGGLFLAACADTENPRPLDIAAGEGVFVPESPAPEPPAKTAYSFASWYDSPASFYDFTTPENAALLGLTGGGYSGGAAVIAAMDARWAAAQASSPVFYPINPILGPVTIDGTNVYYHPVYHDDLNIGFAFNTRNGLLAYAQRGSGAVERSVTFNIAVIDAGGRGWLAGSGAGDLPNYPDAYVLRAADARTGYHRWFSAGELTGGEIASVMGLSGYSIYIIVRMTSYYSAEFSDFNACPVKDFNVIRVR